MKKIQSLVVLCCISTGIMFTSCKDADNVVEPTPTPVAVVTDTIAWPFDECVDSTVRPGDDFYAYSSIGYTKKYGMGVMEEQSVLGRTARNDEIENPTSEVIKKFNHWQSYTEQQIRECEKTAILKYFEDVDTMGVITLFNHLMRNAVCNRSSFVKVDLTTMGRQPLLEMKWDEKLNVSDYVAEQYAQFMDTTVAYIKDLAEQASLIDLIIDEYQPKTSNQDQDEFYKMLIDHSYKPQNIDFTKVDASRMGSTRAIDTTYGIELILQAFGFDPSQTYIIPSTAKTICEFATSDIYYRRDSETIQESLAAYLKIAYLQLSASMTTTYGYPADVTIYKFTDCDFFKSLVSNQYCSNKITTADVNACRELAEQFRSTFNLRLDSLDWMSPTTKAFAKKKLNNMVFLCGLPKSDVHSFDVKVTDADFAVSPSDCFTRLSDRFYDDVILPTIKGNNIEDMVYLLNSYADGSSPWSANAFYDDLDNAMIILASNLIAPICRNDVSLAYNYGVFGATTIGHEMCHGFDAHGSQYDENGNVENWWTVSDALKYKDKQEQMIELFDQYNFKNDEGVQFTVNGSNTLEENMADFGGITIGLDALTRLRKSQGYSDEAIREQMRRYFLAWGMGWSQSTSYQTYDNDVHSPNCVRVWGPASLLDEWYDIFDVKWGDKYYLEPSQRIKLW